MQQRLLPTHHPAEDLLLGYAAGSVTGARALIVSTHLAFCGDCRALVAAAETIGGEILESEPGLSAAQPPGIDARLTAVMPGKPQEDTSFDYLPRHLRGELAGVPANWVDVWFGVKELPIPGYGTAARLLWIPQGRRMPRHDHHGEEMTLVLKGSFSDSTGRYARGDFQTGAPGLDHQPHAGSEGPCICLVVEEGGLKLSGWLGRLVAWRGGRASVKPAA